MAPGDAKFSGYVGWSKPIISESTNSGWVYASFAPRVDAFKLGTGDPLSLAFPAKVGFKLGEDPQHVEEGLAGGR